MFSHRIHPTCQLGTSLILGTSEMKKPAFYNDLVGAVGIEGNPIHLKPCKRWRCNHPTATTTTNTTNGHMIPAMRKEWLYVVVLLVSLALVLLICRLRKSAVNPHQHIVNANQYSVQL